LTHTVLEVNGPDCVAEEFEGEVVALNMQTGTYFSIKDNALRIWNDLVNGHPVEALIAAAGAGTPMAAAIETYAATVVSEGLMRPAGPTLDPRAPLSMLADGELPTLESFSDMQSLLLLDPVHDVDVEQGWPKAKD
jgi:hypothetical protein